MVCSSLKIQGGIKRGRRRITLALSAVGLSIVTRDFRTGKSLAKKLVADAGDAEVKSLAFTKLF